MLIRHSFTRASLLTVTIVTQVLNYYWGKNFPAFSSNNEILKYQQAILLIWVSFLGENYGESCGSCANKVIGSLWSCAVCTNVFLCSECYMDDAHDVKHEFRRKTSLSCKW